MHPAANAILGGWQIAGIQVIQSGQALAFPTNTSVIFNGKFRDIPLASDQQSTARWLNTAAGFELNSAAQLDMGRQIRTFPIRFGFLRQDRVHNYDLSVLKKTFIGEGKYAEFKFDFLNALNAT